MDGWYDDAVMVSEDPRAEVAMLQRIGASSAEPHPGIVRLLDVYPEGGGTKYWAVLGEFQRFRSLLFFFSPVVFCCRPFIPTDATNKNSTDTKKNIKKRKNNDIEIHC